MSEPKVLLSGLGIPESPRWHEGRLWFCNWIDRQVVALGLDGRAEVMAVRDPDSHPMGYSIDWLPDGRLLVTGDKRHGSSLATGCATDEQAEWLAGQQGGNIPGTSGPGLLAGNREPGLDRRGATASMPASMNSPVPQSLPYRPASGRPENRARMSDPWRIPGL